MIVVDKVSKTYSTAAVLQDVSVRFEPRQLTSLIGPNGAGKTTLLRMIGRHLAPDTGTIKLNGKSIAAIPRCTFAKRVATLGQSPQLNLRLTVRELVAFGRFPHSQGALTAADHKAIDQALAFLELAPLQNASIDELSGGERQLAFLAMTMAQQTDVLLLDEPLNNLDMSHAVTMMRALRHLCDEHNRTVILVIHDINFAANYSDRIVALKAGRVHQAGTVAEVVCAQSLHELYGIDFEIIQGRNGPVCNYFKP